MRRVAGLACREDRCVYRRLYIAIVLCEILTTITQVAIFIYLFFLYLFIYLFIFYFLFFIFIIIIIFFYFFFIFFLRMFGNTTVVHAEVK